jgi:hypothetical protein
MRFWSMPGPDGFIGDVMDCVADGMNVVIAVPSEAAGDPGEALLDRLRQRVIDLVDVGETGSPAAQVTRALGVESSATCVDDLMSEPRFENSGLIFIQGLNAERWPVWNTFFTDYDDLSKDLPVGRRPQAIIVLKGMDLPAEVRESVTFRGYRWFGRVSDLDLTQYVFRRLELSLEGEGGRLLAASIVAKISLGDVDLADEFARRPVKEIWKPEGVLREWATRRGWVKGTHRHWTKGTVFSCNGREETHSALVVLEDPGGIVKSRVWAAQAAMLLPGIERERLKLIRRARNYLRPPFLLADGERTASAEDLEIGPLEYQLTRGRAPEELRRRAREIREIRNKLAHMESLTVEESLYSGLL